MDDVTIRVLLSRFVKQALLDARGETIDDDQFAEAVASAAWNSLIYLMRQSLVHQGRVTLQEVGEFVKESGNWRFHPAASLAEADAFRLPATEGRKQLARLALFHLDQGRDLAQSIPKDVENPRAPERRQYLTISGEEAADTTLASELRKVAVEIFGLARNLSTQEMFDVQLEPMVDARAGASTIGPPPPAKLDRGSVSGRFTDIPARLDNIVEELKSGRVPDASPEVISLDDLVGHDE